MKETGPTMVWIMKKEQENMGGEGGSEFRK